MILVHHILDAARARLAVLDRNASVCEAAAILSNPETPLVIVCNDIGAAVGVVTRGDIVGLVARAGTESIRSTTTGAIMTSPVITCHVDETLQRVWGELNQRSIRCAPVLDSNDRPQGIVHARDLARALLDEASYEDDLLRQYFLGIGYQ